MNKILKKIQPKLAGSEDIFSALKNLPNSELNSFLLELFRIKSRETSPTELLKQFENNRFVTPADTDVLKLKETELSFLKYAKENNFTPINLSPLAPFGSSSAISYVNQNNVVSALRGTEIVSDATNILALKIAKEFKAKNNKKLVLRYATTHRHVRGQYFTNPKFSAHFSVLCLTSGGFDTGNYGFEISQINEHMRVIYNLITQKFNKDELVIRLYFKANSEQFLNIIKTKKDLFWLDKNFEFIEDFENKYYSTIQFKIFVKKKNQEIDLGDGGIVDWTQKLLENKKHRLFISGIGLDLMERIS